MARKGELRDGWPLVLTCAIGVGLSAIALPFYTIGVLIAPLEADFGWSRTQIQQAILFSTGCGAISAPIIGLLTDRYGVRRVALPSIIGLSIAFALASLVTASVWTFYAAFAAISLLGAGTNPVTWTRAIAGRFVAQRGLALGLALTGTGLCAVLAPQFALWVLSAYGWRAVFLGLAALVLLLSFPAAFLFLKDGQAQEEEAAAQWGFTLQEAARQPRFYLLLSSIFCVYLAVSGIIPNLIPALSDGGFDASAAAKVASLVGLALMAGRLVIGWLIDRVWAPGVAAVATALPIIACIILMGAPSGLSASIAALLIGFAAGAELDLLAFFTARYFGLAHYAKLYGVFYIALAVAGGSAPALFALGYDVAGSYTASFAACAALFALSSLLILGLGKYPNQARQTQP
ncbi:MAG: MFS transporter [Pseudomonadota bacterium]